MTFCWPLESVLSMLSNAEILRQWLRTCPAIIQSSKFGLDYLSDQPDEYAVFTVPSSISARENIWGELILDDIQTENFIFASKENYSPSAAQNSTNLVLHQMVIGWILEQNNAGNFPKWNGTILSIVPTLTAAPVQIGSSVAKYQIQLKVTYRRGEDNGKD